MQLSGRCAHALTGVCGLVFEVVLATGASQAARPPASPVPAPQGPPRSGPPSTSGAPAAGQATYAGEDTCLTCHADRSRLELGPVIPRTQVVITYDFSRSETDYVYQLGSPDAERTLPEGSPITTLPPVGQLPQVSNQLHTARLDTRYFLTARFALGVVYLYEQYRVRDYALGDETIRRIDLPNGLLMYYRYRPYDAHSVWARITYVF